MAARRRQIWPLRRAEGYLYGEHKPFMFHSRAWIDALARRPGGRIVGLRTGLWVMLNRPQAFNAAVTRWLAESAPATGR